SRVTRSDGSLERVRATRAAEFFSTLECRKTTTDEQLIPQRPILIEQHDGLSRWAVRAPERDAWISIKATRPWTSGSLGASSASTRPRRNASSQRPGRIQSSPAVAEYPSLKIR